MKTNTGLDRRTFLSIAAGAGTYSVLVKVDGPSTVAADPAETSKSFDSVAPAVPGSDALADEPHMTLVELACDLFVAGGGMSGVCAAIAAARNGAKVVLVQDRSRLGGNSSSEVKMHIVGADIHGSRPGWREGGLIEEFRLDDAVQNPQRSREMWDLLLYDKCQSEPNLTLLLDTTVCRAAVKEGQIQWVLARCDKSEHLYRVQAKIYSDCTGDCRLGLEAGAEMRRGREAKSEFNESLALDQADEATLGSSILFTARDYARPMSFRAPTWARKITKEMLKFRPVTTWEYGYWWIEWGGAIDTIRDNERIRFELLAITLGVWDYIKNSGEHPSSANWALDWMGMVPGKRGSRRIRGDFVLTENDCMGRNDAPGDGVCIGGWSLDDHPPGGFDQPDLRPARQVPPPFPYNIPLRCLYSRNISNLMMAGRNISASHVAFTSTRVMATCAAIGQAMGTAAAYALQLGLRPRDITQDKARVRALQQRLLRDDQTIRLCRNEDPLDLARQADVAASDFVEGASPEHVTNGYVRDLPTKWDNRWAAPLKDGGAWLDFEWKQPQTFAHVQITFDTGFHRELTHSQQATKYPAIIWGPQPETVRDYQLLYRSPGLDEWKILGTFTGNYQRLRRHTFAPVQARALRLQILATHGDPLARVYEVRCYATPVSAEG